MKRKIYVSHLIPDRELKIITEKYQVGVEIIDFAIGMNLDHLPKSIRDYQNRMNRISVQGPFSVHGPFLDLNPASFDPAVARITAERFSQAYEAAKAIGASRIIFHSGFLPSVHFLEGWSEQASKFWDGFLNGKDGSLEIHMENLLDQKSQAFAKVFQLVDCPFFTACLDMGHLHCYSEDSVGEWMDALQGRIGHLHCHDNRGEQDSHLAMGDGTVDWNLIAKFYKQYCPEGSITIENNHSSDVEKSLKRLGEFLK